jgi:trimethyllysine dioxygenase
MLDLNPRRHAAEVLLSGARLADGEVELSWVGERSTRRFSFFWLRDHCHSKHSLHPETLQRQVDTFAIPVDIAPERLEIGLDGRELRIVWRHDGSLSVLPAAFLWEIGQSEGRDHEAAAGSSARSLWDRASIGESFPGDGFPTLSHEEIVSGDDGLLRWLSLVERYGFALASGTPPTLEATRALATRIGYVRETIFGGMWDFTANLAFKDTAYTSAAIGPHTDGTYSLDPPGFQMFHCLSFDGTGGESTLVDGFKVAEQIRKSDLSRRWRAPQGRASGHRPRREGRVGADRLQ